MEFRIVESNSDILIEVPGSNLSIKMGDVDSIEKRGTYWPSDTSTLGQWENSLRLEKAKFATVRLNVESEAAAKELTSQSQNARLPNVLEEYRSDNHLIRYLVLEEIEYDIEFDFSNKTETARPKTKTKAVFITTRGIFVVRCAIYAETSET